MVGTSGARSANFGYLVDAGFLWQSGKMTPLMPQGTTSFEPHGINEKGGIVGWVDTANKSQPFLWQDGRMHDLNQMIPRSTGWVLEEAVAINDRGQIVCNGYARGDGNGSKRALLLTPVKP